jgi:trk system potassium uptake protein
MARLRRSERHEFAVIGLGRFGSSLGSLLVERGHYVLGIDRDRDIVQRMADTLTRVVALDSTDAGALHAVDMSAFETVIVAIGTNFEANVLTTVELKTMGVRQVVCKATSERQRTILLRVGADRVVLPEHDAGRRLARELVAPNVLDSLELGTGYSISEIVLPPGLAGQSLAEAELRRTQRLNVLMIRRGEEHIISPPAEFRFERGDLVFVLGLNSDIQHFCELA